MTKWMMPKGTIVPTPMKIIFQTGKQPGRPVPVGVLALRQSLNGWKWPAFMLGGAGSTPYNMIRITCRSESADDGYPSQADPRRKGGRVGRRSLQRSRSLPKGPALGLPTRVLYASACDIETSEIGCRVSAIESHPTAFASRFGPRSRHRDPSKGCGRDDVRNRIYVRKPSRHGKLDRRILGGVGHVADKNRLSVSW